MPTERSQRTLQPSSRRNQLRRLVLQSLETRRLLVGDDQIGEAIPAVFGTNFGEIDNNNDIDMWSIELSANASISIDVDSVDRFLDSVIRVFDGTGSELDSNDDRRGPGNEFSNLESFLEFTAPVAGTYYIGISSYSNFTYDPVLGGGNTDGGSSGLYDLNIFSVTNDYLFTVNTTGDLPDDNVGDGVAQDSNGNTSLRAAIEELNAIGADDAFVFVDFTFGASDVDPSTGRVMIQPNTPLPRVLETASFETFGVSATNLPPVQIDGTFVSGGATDGIQLAAPGTIFSDFAIANFPGDGIELDLADGSEVSGNSIFGNGGNGLRLVDTAGVSVFDNEVFMNTRSGIQITGSSSIKNQVFENDIGVYTFNGTPDVPGGNGSAGILIQSPSNSVSSNTVGDNGGIGISVSPTPQGNADFNTISNNIVGTDSSGNDLGNGSFGILIKSASNLVDGNTVSGSARSGLVISGQSADNNQVEGNYIGTDPSGTFAVPNAAFGLLLTGGDNNTIGGPTLLERNYVSGNGTSGVVIATGADNNTVQGNHIGLDSNGNPLGNGSTGVFVRAGATGTRVIDNTIGANSGTQLLIVGANTTGTEVESNRIGFDSSFAPVSGGANAILIQSPGNTIGGLMMSQANYISGSTTGITLSKPTANNNEILHNFIGTDSARSDFGIGTGIRVTSGAANNNIQGNYIGHNDRAIQGTASAGTGNTISQNEMFSNGFGIDLLPLPNALNANDVGDPDTGVNNLQNSATSLVVNASPVSPTELDISFNYNVDSSPANTAYPLTVEFFSATFASVTPDQTVQGEFYLGMDTFTTADYSNGGASISAILDVSDLSASITHGTATVTDALGNTSEFAFPVPVNFLPPPSVSAFTNPINPLDVNGQEGVTLLDALLVMNQMSAEASGVAGETAVFGMTDTSGDGKVTPWDALQIMNHLNAIERATQSALAVALEIDVADDDEDKDDVESWDIALAQLV